jgi:predicted nucleotide-binding protein
MDKLKLEEMLTTGGFEVASDTRLPNDKGWQIKLSSGQIICLYDTGKLQIQGKNQDLIREMLGPWLKSTETILKKAKAASRKVFVVYGHDDKARTELEAMLRRWDLEPLILDQLPTAGQTIIEKLESVRQEANFAVILATPDDEGHRAGHPDEMAFRARQNVVLELGMMLALLGRPRVAILLKSQTNMERPSDIQGLIYIPFKESVKEAALTLAKEFDSQGIRIDLGRV